LPVVEYINFEKYTRSLTL